MAAKGKTSDDELMELTLQLRNRPNADKQYATFHGDNLIGDKVHPQEGFLSDLTHVYKPSNWAAFGRVLDVKLKNLLHLSDAKPTSQDVAQLAGSYSNYSTKRQALIDMQVKTKYDAMLHPPLTYLGDAFQYRTADGKFNSALNPHLGQAGAPYAKTVPAKTAPIGAMPDPEDIFDRLMARQAAGRESQSGLSSMLIYHATIIIHDIFRTNEKDKNISDSSSYLDLSPLYGYTEDMVRSVRDDKYKLGFLKPDTFAEDRLLRQPPGVCIMLVMYNRYHNYAAAQLRRINENNRFSVPKKYQDTRLVATAKAFYPTGGKKVYEDDKFLAECAAYETAWYKAQFSDSSSSHIEQAHPLEHRLEHAPKNKRKDFEELYDAAWKKLDDDLFNTARLITCGIYIQISIHDYLRALMGFHAYDTNFTLDPRSDFDQRKTTRGIGNQVTVEFNCMYRFHCAISLKDETYTEQYMQQYLPAGWDPKKASLADMGAIRKATMVEEKKAPEDREFGLPGDFTRNSITGLFDDQKLTDALIAAMDDPISNFGPRNVPKCMKPIEIMGILQARKWNIGTLNDFREFFNMPRHTTFESITGSTDIQNALRDLYEHPDKVELYPGIFCESDEYMGLDPGPSKNYYALWVAIFSDAITLVRSDRFYTVDWNTNSLTSWGMKEVTPDNETCKSSVFHRLVQRAFPGWFPYNSVRFFHPFYTASKNAEYARAQGYDADFKLYQPNLKTKLPELDLALSNPMKPEKPVYLYDYEKIFKILNDADNFIHPALRDRANLPPKMYEVLHGNGHHTPEINVYAGETMGPDLTAYLSDLMRSIVKRESIETSKQGTFQIDATRDFAIPVVTRYIADFLGFGHLIRTEKDLSAKFSENEIYQHITNVQVFLSSSTDETKLMARRRAFRSSMEALLTLTKDGNIAEANSWGVFQRRRGNEMVELGFKTAGRILQHETDVEKAASILLFVGLDFAYNSVLAFTSVLSGFFDEIYDAANPKKRFTTSPTWLKVQTLAFSKKAAAQSELDEIIQTAARTSVRLPIVRTALEGRKYAVGTEGEWSVKAGQRVILDINEATKTALKPNNRRRDLDFLTYQSSFVEKFAAYHPKHVAATALTTMIKFIATMRNPRRGHDAQGHVKKIEFDWTAEGYSNFMAPGRVLKIARQADNKKVYTRKVLVPAVDTYLTAEWDELLPFPTTWKIRFDGFGRSDYSDEKGAFGKLYQTPMPDDGPPWYQPQGPSHFGGSFAEGGCACGLKRDAEGKVKGRHGHGHGHGHDVHLTAAEREVTHSSGCGMSG